jgi:PPK2 family polyphosphate:nucleotide phosphotransferase
MDSKQLLDYLDTLIVQPNQKVSLDKDFKTDHDGKFVTKEQGVEMLQEGILMLSDMQEKLYAHNRYSILVVLQAMDAAGKDSAIKHVMSGFNPQGVKVTSFKKPSVEELEYNFLWRHYKALPARGEIGIFNRSHYENVLVTRVHPEYILGENLPGVEKTSDITEEFWDKRYKQINRFEKNLAQNGMVIIKIFLHVSKKEQKKRFLERIDEPAKNWKFSLADVDERNLWNEYMAAYESMLGETSTSIAPWHVVPADDKWFSRLCIAAIIAREFNRIETSFPVLSKDQLQELQRIREKLVREPD